MYSITTMGNLLIVSTQSCAICSKHIRNYNHVRCYECREVMHVYCEEEYRNGRKYFKCPICESVGTLSYQKKDDSREEVLQVYQTV